MVRSEILFSRQDFFPLRNWTIFSESPLRQTDANEGAEEVKAERFQRRVRIMGILNEAEPWLVVQAGIRTHGSPWGPTISGRQTTEAWSCVRSGGPNCWRNRIAGSSKLWLSRLRISKYSRRNGSADCTKKVFGFFKDHLAIELDLSFPGKHLVRMLNRLKEIRGLPNFVVFDNRSKLPDIALDNWVYTIGVIPREKSLWLEDRLNPDAIRTTLLPMMSNLACEHAF